ncbi:MAG: ATP-binding protein [Magnetovibrio sp.]|nr:ATP-binding protein [Magnetovibrio sp.]
MADYLLACLTLVTNARPLFGVFLVETGKIQWTGGGAEVASILDPHVTDKNQVNVSDLSELLALFEFEEDHSASIVETAGHLAPDSAMSVMRPLVNRDGRAFRIVMRRRNGKHEREVQFSMMDVTPFRETARRTRKMAEALVKGLDKPLNGYSAHELLNGVVSDLDKLFALQDDAEIENLAHDMSDHVTQASERMVEMLREFENEAGGAQQWQPQNLIAKLRPVISVHNLPVKDWHELYHEVLRTDDGVPALIPDIVEEVKHAYSFVRHASTTMLISPTEERYFALNGPAAEQQFSTIEELVRAIGVEENSRQTAIEFFSSLKDHPRLGLFAVNGENVHAWGRPGLFGGWQSTLVPAMQINQIAGVDVRGLFHGLKNLLLHLQVLYVVKNRADVDQVQNGLQETGEKIKARLSDLVRIAKTGKRAQVRAEESVGQWLLAAQKVGHGVAGDVEVVSDDSEHIVYSAVASEMEDALEELVRNAFQHGAGLVVVGAMQQGDHLCMHVTDDGPGMNPDKLIQVQKVLEKRVHDPSLSTREDGTGNGLLAASNAVSRFVDGHLSVEQGPNGRGVKVGISMKLPI